MPPNHYTDDENKIGTCIRYHLETVFQDYDIVGQKTIQNLMAYIVDICMKCVNSTEIISTIIVNK